MSLADAFEAIQANRQPRKTRIDEIRAQLSAEDATTLDAMLLDPNVAHATISRVLTQQGYPIGENTVGRARSRQVNGL